MNRFFRRGDTPLLMGILNATPDSFSDGGRYLDPDAALAHALELVSEGADIIDIGAESTRPGATPVSEREELSRILPVVDAVVSATDVPVSVDTMKASVARACVEHGAAIINDVSGLADTAMAATAAELHVPIVLMSSYGSPATFKTSFIPGDTVAYAKETLSRLVDAALDAGVDADSVILDPGIGFGTDPPQAMEMLRNSSEFSLGRYPVLIGPSRKRFLSKFFGDDPDTATARACVIAAESGADILRVHAPGKVMGFFGSDRMPDPF